MPSLIRPAVVAAAALALAGCQPAEDAFGRQVRAYLLAHPEVIQEAVEALQAKQRAEAGKVSAAALAQHRQALERDSRDFVANPNGTITVVEFFDYRCGYCKVAAPEVVKLIQENPDVRFVFKEFPIFGGVSNLAAGVMATPEAKPKTLELYQAMMADKDLDEAAIDRHLASQGVDAAAARKSAETPAVQKHLADTHALAQALNVQGTPAFFVGDKVIPGADIEALRLAIANVRAGKASGT